MVLLLLSRFKLTASWRSSGPARDLVGSEDTDPPVRRRSSPFGIWRSDGQQGFAMMQYSGPLWKSLF